MATACKNTFEKDTDFMQTVYQKGGQRTLVFGRVENMPTVCGLARWTLRKGPASAPAPAFEASTLSASAAFPAAAPALLTTPTPTLLASFFFSRHDLVDDCGHRRRFFLCVHLVCASFGLRQSCARTRQSGRT